MCSKLHKIRFRKDNLKNLVNKILDFGAGQGFFAKLLKQYYNKADIKC